MKNKTIKQGYQTRQPEVSRKKELPVPLPDVINMDDIGTITDDVLIEKLRTIESDRDKAAEAYFDPQPWEVEAAYVKRELQLRRYRHQLHEQYLVQLDREADEAQRIENTYPVADLDNSAYMFFN